MVSIRRLPGMVVSGQLMVCDSNLFRSDVESRPLITDLLTPCRSKVGSCKNASDDEQLSRSSTKIHR